MVQRPLLAGLLGALFYFNFAFAEAPPCDLKTNSSLPQILIIGEAHAELIDATNPMSDADTKAVLASTEMRKSIFRDARKGLFTLASEIYVASDEKSSAPFFPPLKNREDSNRDIFGIEADDVIALSANYESMDRYFSNDRKRPASVLTGILYDSVRFSSDVEVWSTLVKLADKIPELQSSKEGLRLVVHELQTLRKDKTVVSETEVRRFPDSVKTKLNSLFPGRFSQTEMQTIVETFHAQLTNLINQRHGVSFKAFKPGDEDNGALKGLRDGTQRLRDKLFARSMVQHLCEAVVSGRRNVVINMGGAHVDGFISELETFVGKGRNMKVYRTYKDADLDRLKRDLDLIANHPSDAASAVRK